MDILNTVEQLKAALRLVAVCCHRSARTFDVLLPTESVE